MKTVVKGYFVLLPGDAYLVLDKDKNEIGKLDVLDDGTVAVHVGVEDHTFEEKEFQEWFTEKGYLLAKTSPRFVEFNPNPTKNVKANDCTIRAYCAAENLTWEEAYDIASKRGKDCAYMPNDKTAVHEIIEQEFGYTKKKVSKEDKGMTVSEFAIKYDKGTYLVEVARHLVAVVDGKYFDTWDSGKKKVSCYFKKN